VNFIQQTTLFRYAMEKLAGFDHRRVLPEYAREPFYQWFERNGSPYKNSERRVVLFADTYLNFHEPNIGISALQLLNACGYEVILANVGCCQRPKISHGFLREAKTEGTKTVAGLQKYIDQGLTIVVCEPSCASSLNDDLPDLIEDEALGIKLKAQVMMIDKFLERETAAGRLDK